MTVGLRQFIRLSFLIPERHLVHQLALASRIMWKKDGFVRRKVNNLPGVHDIKKGGLTSSRLFVPYFMKFKWFAELDWDV